MEGERSCYRGGQFKGGRRVLLQWRLFNGKGIGHVREVASLMEGEWSCYLGGHFKGERIIVTEVASLKKGECSLQRWSV